MQTMIRKGRDGWEAETRIPLNDTQSLKVDTRKGASGVITSAIVIEPTAHGFKWVPMSDFHETLRHGRTLRCTESTVRAEHAAALANVDDLKRRALAHYATDNNAQG